MNRRKTEPKSNKIGQEIYSWIADLFPICRSLTGEGVRQTLKYIQNIHPEMNIEEIKSGTKVFDWVVPSEWNINDGWIKNSKGEKIVDFKSSNLHVLGYSEPVHKFLSLQELDKYLHSIPEQPDAIPYLTSYYNRRWGFCLTHHEREKLKDDEYEVFIDSSLQPGVLNYGELYLPCETKNEILFSTNICHPSMANNELSGPAVLMALMNWIKNLTNRKYSYRFLFIPETIGSLIYISRHFEHLKEYLKAGFVVSCVGDTKNYTFVHTPDGDKYVDRIVEHIYKHHTGNQYRKLPFTERGSDERQFCAPGVELPVVALSRSKYGMFPEYHTSLDNLSFISPEGLESSFELMKKIVQSLEIDTTYKTRVLGEPQLGKRGLYPTLSNKETYHTFRNIMNLIAYSNGKRSLLEIAEKTDVYVGEYFPILNKLLEEEILEEEQVNK